MEVPDLLVDDLRTFFGDEAVVDGSVGLWMATRIAGTLTVGDHPASGTLPERGG